MPSSIWVLKNERETWRNLPAIPDKGSQQNFVTNEFQEIETKRISLLPYAVVINGILCQNGLFRVTKRNEKKWHDKVTSLWNKRTMLKFFVLNSKVLNYTSPHSPLRLRPLWFYRSDSASLHSPPRTPPPCFYSKLGTLLYSGWGKKSSTQCCESGSGSRILMIKNCKKYSSKNLSFSF